MNPVDIGLAFLEGLALLSAKLSEIFSALTQGLANFGNQLASTGGKGGAASAADYQQVSSGKTCHAESVKVINDRPKVERLKAQFPGLFR